MLHLRELTKRYGPLTAVDGLSLHVRTGEIFGLLGPNGAGKSTIVNLIVGLLEADSGSIGIGPNELSSVAARKHVGVAPQALALYMDLSAQENLSFFGKLYGLRGKQLKTRVEWALDFVDLSERKDDLLSTYSGGMKRRVNLAAAILHEPMLLLLDEPTVGVDPQSRNAILERVVSLKDEGCTVIYTSHYMEEVERVCDRIAIVDHGKLLTAGSVGEIIAKHGGDQKVIATGEQGEESFSMADPSSAIRSIARVQGLKGFQTQHPSLETVFLNLTGRSLKDK